MGFNVFKLAIKVLEFSALGKTFINTSKNPTRYEEKFKKMEKERPNALEMAKKEN
jgi:hypothetical protein